MPAKRSWGVIFDWDGVIVDSGKTHEEAWNLAAAQFGFPHTHQDFKRHFGARNDRAIRDILRWTDDPEKIEEISLKKEENYRTLLAEEEGETLPGVKELLARLADWRIPCAIASSGPLLNIGTQAERLGIRPYFQSIVTGDDVTRSKPDPEGFLLAARRIERAPKVCVVVEDAPVGVEAGLAAGMQVIGVATSHPPETLTKAHLVVSRLDRLSVEQIQGLLNADGGKGL